MNYHTSLVSRLNYDTYDGGNKQKHLLILLNVTEQSQLITPPHRDHELLMKPSVPPHLQVIQEPRQVQAPLSCVPVVVGPDVCEASICKHTVVVLCPGGRK